MTMGDGGIAVDGHGFRWGIPHIATKYRGNTMGDHRLALPSHIHGLP